MTRSTATGGLDGRDRQGIHCLVSVYDKEYSNRWAWREGQTGHTLSSTATGGLGGRGRQGIHCLVSVCVFFVPEHVTAMALLTSPTALTTLPLLPSPLLPFLSFPFKGSMVAVLMTSSTLYL